jgi:hypothetical protein
MTGTIKSDPAYVAISQIFLFEVSKFGNGVRPMEAFLGLRKGEQADNHYKCCKTESHIPTQVSGTKDCQREPSATAIQM